MDKKNRRAFLSDALKIAAGVTTASFIHSPASVFADSFSSDVAEPDHTGNVQVFQFAQIPLPYAYSALQPYIDAATMELHYSKHHSTYVKNVNEAISSEKLNFKNATEFFANTSKLSAKARNNGGGSWNHNMFWQIMHPAPASPSAPKGKLANAITSEFGSFEKFKELFTQAAMTRFGSGWAWLVHDNGKLKIGSTPNQDNPLMDVSDFKGSPLLCLDVWEHAYYLKYQNRRNEYVAAWWNLVNWDAVERRFA